jgi:putative mRNA 3-end processing factor
MSQAVIQLTPEGIYCPEGGFHIDPWGPVERAVITHAHSDHARPGMGSYLCSRASEPLLRARLGGQARIQTVDYGERVTIGAVRVSLHPAGHVPGSAQVRIEQGGQVAVIAGDYRLVPDETCAPFEPVRCHHFVTESTFGLPVYRWRPPREVFAEINEWWRSNREEGRPSVLFAYALGKAQRLLAGIDSSIGPIVCHGAIGRMNEACREAGVSLPDCRPVSGLSREELAEALVIAPPSAGGSLWMRRFGEASTAMASGWMQIRGARRRRAVDRGFVLSDHADWDGLNEAVRLSGAETVWVTHGHSEALARWLREQGLDARAVQTRFEGETAEEGLREEGEEGA